MATDAKELAVTYIDAVGKKQFEQLSTLFHSNLEFTSPTSVFQSAQEYISILRRLDLILLRNDIKKMFVDRNDVCVIYDFEQIQKGAQYSLSEVGERSHNGHHIYTNSLSRFWLPAIEVSRFPRITGGCRSDY